MRDLLRFPTLFLALLLPLAPAAQNAPSREITYADAWADEGLQLVQSGSQGLVLSFSIERFTLTTVTINGQEMTEVGLPGVFLPGESGAPNLPGMGRYLALPEGATASLHITGMRTETIKGLRVAPAPEIPLETEDGLVYAMDESIYTSNSPFPAQPVQLGSPSEIRGVDACMLGITPFQYNPVTRELTVIRDLTIEVRFSGGTGYFGEDRLRSRWWDPILRDVFLNSSSLPAIDYTLRSNPNELGYEYLIISPNNPQYLAWADTILQWRTLQGIKTGVVTLSDIGSNTTAAIESYINTAYNTWTIPPAAVLLLADYGTGAVTANGIHSPTYNNYCISDHLYADVSGNHMADIAFARMTAQTEAQLALMVQKFIDYETNPPTSTAFYSNPVTAMGWQTERWFQLCSETVNGFLQYGLGKTPVRENAIYSGTPGGAWSTATNTSTVVNYFGPSGLGYIPSATAHLTDWGGNATRVNADLNAGAFILQHRDHGFESGWGEPDYTTTNLSGLNNNDLPFIFSVNCLTGKFDHSSETFAEAFHRYPKRALGIIAATEVSYSFVNDAYVWGLYDYMWPEFMPAYGLPGQHQLLPAFGNVAGKYFLQQSSWPYNTSNKEVTYYLFHHHGDAFTTVFSEVPQMLSVVHDPVLLAGVNTFSVTADSGALICLSHNGEILSTGTGIASALSMPVNPLLPGEQLVVTVTKQDHYRYSVPVLVIPPSGPYIIRDEVFLNDANQNGQADYGEEVQLSLQVKNVGIAQASNVNITVLSNDAWIQLLDSTESYGNIAADTTVVFSNGFRFRVADSLNDGHKASFSVHATDGTDTWNSLFQVTLHAPSLALPSITILDPTGNNNGLPDPGETVTVVVDAMNQGSAGTAAAVQHLISTSPYLQISGSPFVHSVLAPGALSPATYTMTVDPNTPNGENLDLIAQLSSAPYLTDRIFFHPVGEVTEDFETGNLQKYAWVTGGSANWTVTNSLPYQGTWCARSGIIGNNASTYLQITLNILADDTISFFRKVSSEASYDFLEFYIDNVKAGEWSGNQAWGKVSFPVTSGSHTFKWVYDKDWYATGGSDAAWIDNIEFPPILAPGAGLEVRAAAIDNSLCLGESTTLYAVTTGGSASTTLEWAPATGLNNAWVNNPQASPSLTTNYRVIAQDGSTFDTAWVNVAVHALPEIMLGPSDTSLCATASITLDATVTDGLSYLWSPGGQATAALTVDSTGTGFGSVTYSVVATDIYGCSDEESMTITFVDCAGVDEAQGSLGLEVYPNPSNGWLVVRLGKATGRSTLRLLDARAALVQQWELGAGERQLEILLEGVSQGLYFLRVDSGQESQTLKLILR